MADEHKDEHGEAHGDAKGHSGGHKGGHAPGGHGGEHEEGGCPEWMISFADNTALMMGLFVILLAMNMGPKATSQMGGDPADHATETASQSESMLDFAISVREAFNNPVDMGASEPRDEALRERIRRRQMQGQSPSPGNPGKERNVDAQRPSDYYTRGGIVQFPHNSSDLTPDARQVAADIAAQVRGMRWVIEVRGHASVSETFRNPDKGNRLAFERASAVAQALVENGVKWSQMRLVSCGDSFPAGLVSGDPSQNASSERTEVLMTQELLPRDPFTLDRGARSQDQSAAPAADAEAGPQAPPEADDDN
jgi:outer membrane protein OmpA-like peptidoglycan-associated protein